MVQSILKQRTSKITARKSSIKGCVALLCMGFLAGCSQFQKVSQYKNSILNNLNPAPERMGPPKNYDKVAGKFSEQTNADYQFSLGEAYSLDGQFEKAIEAFKSTLIYDPKSAVVKVRLAEEYVKSGLYSEGLEEAEAALRIDDKYIPGRLLLGTLYAKLKMYDLAMSQFQVVMDLDLDNEEAPLYLGALLAEQLKYKQASLHFKELIQSKVRKKNKDIYSYYLGRIYAEWGPDKYSLAEKAYANSLAMNPQNEKAVLSLARLHLLQKRETSAVKLLEGYQEKFRSGSEMAHMLSQIYLDRDQFKKAYAQMEMLEGFDGQNLNLKLQMSVLLIRLKDFMGAKQKLSEILLMVPDSDKVLFYLGSVCEELKDYNGAVEHYERIVPESTYYIEARLHEAEIYKKANRISEAIETIEQAVQSRPESIQLYAYYASLLDETKNYQKAVTMLEIATQQFPESTQLHFYLGSMYDRLGNMEKTIETLTKVIGQDEHHVQALNYLAYTYAELGTNLHFAEELAQRALEIRPNDAYILDTKGWILFKQGKIAESIVYLERAFAAQAGESIIAMHLADAYLKHQLSAKALQMYRIAEKLEKDDTKAQTIRNKITALFNQVQSEKSVRQPASISPAVESN